ncbi:MAG: PID-CTERM protein-sorting domain-containing protein [Balneola sp.]
MEKSTTQRLSIARQEVSHLQEMKKPGNSGLGAAEKKKAKKREETRQEKLLDKVKNWRAFSLLFLINLVLLNTEVFAQPGFPSTPSQAPIDGGLGLLAAAGGAYAIKKLRRKNNEE